MSALRQLLIEEEGRIPHAYPDSTPERYLTIGVGHLIDKRLGGGLPDSIIDALLDYDVAEKSAQAARIAGFERLNLVQQAAVVSMVFQLGFTGVGSFPKFCAALAAGDVRRAAIEGLHSKWAREDSPRRAKRQMRMLETGVWQPFNVS